MPLPRQFSYRKMLEALAGAGADFVVINGVCAVTHGAPITTFDLDVLYAVNATNIDRILAVLSDLEAYNREPGSRQLAPKRAVLERGGPALFMTKFGALDFLGDLSGTPLEALQEADIEHRQIHDHLTVRVLALNTLIAVKTAAGRAKDLAVLPILRQTLEILRERNSGP
ncbi:MAG: hypothetical protein ACI8W8_001665 [Rhodothermales bacterium]|jgi:hypothetical protein